MTKDEVKELEKVSGGGDYTNKFRCPKCGSRNYSSQIIRISPKKTIKVNKCQDCGETWKYSYEASDSDDSLQ